jgi:hypothetical protein
MIKEWTMVEIAQETLDSVERDLSKALGLLREVEADLGGMRAAFRRIREICDVGSDNVHGDFDEIRKLVEPYCK